MPRLSAVGISGLQAGEDVNYADEDLGSNCGTFTLKAGQIVKQDIAPNWRDMTDEEKARWNAFACEVTGRSLAPDEED